MTVACEDMNSIIQDDLDKGEAIYPGKIDSIKGVPGIGKVMLYWQLNTDPRITKTVISWNGGTPVERSAPGISVDSLGNRTRIDSTEITGLSEGLYTFSAYTVDKDGHRSITMTSSPINVYGKVYVNSLSARGISTMEMQVGGNIKIEWQDAAPDLLITVVTYTDFSESETGVTKVDTVLSAVLPNNVKRTSTLTGLKRLKPFSVKSVFQIGLDTASVTGSYYPYIAEKDILSASGFTELTAEAAAKVKKISYPFGMESWTLRDLYYFPDLEELDFTPGTVDTELETLSYYREYVGKYNDTTRYSGTVGGGDWCYFMSGYMSDNDKNIIRDLLTSGQLTKVKYTRNSYPGLDDILAQSSATIDWIPATLPDDGIPIPDKFLLDFRVENKDRGATVEYSADGSIIPAEIAELNELGVELKNVYRMQVIASNSTITFSLPTGVQFGFNQHGRLKADIYIQPSGNAADQDYEWLKGYSKYSYRTLRVIRQTKLPNFGSHSPYDNPGSDAWFTNASIPDDALGKWTTLEWNLSGYSAAHIRALSIQAGEDGAAWGLPSGKQVIYYLANLRFSK
jgi:hypothetical protein